MDKEGEQEADEDIRLGRIKNFLSVEEAIAYLHNPNQEDDISKGE